MTATRTDYEVVVDIVAAQAILKYKNSLPEDKILIQFLMAEVQIPTKEILLALFDAKVFNLVETNLSAGEGMEKFIKDVSARVNKVTKDMDFTKLSAPDKKESDVASMSTSKSLTEEEKQANRDAVEKAYQTAVIYMTALVIKEYKGSLSEETDLRMFCFVKAQLPKQIVSAMEKSIFTDLSLIDKFVEDVAALAIEFKQKMAAALSETPAEKEVKSSEEKEIKTAAEKKKSSVAPVSLFKNLTLQDKEVKGDAAEKSKEIAFDQDVVIDLCLKKSCKEYDRQKSALSAALNAVKSKEPLTIGLMKKIHIAYIPDQHLDERYMDPYIAEERYDFNYPGRFRDIIVGTSGFKDDGYFTEQGVAEMLKIIKSESKEGFPAFKGTVLGPKNPDVPRQLIASRLIHHNIAEKQGELTDQEFAKKVFAETQADNFVALFPRTNNDDLSIREYMEIGMEKNINDFNNRMKDVKNNDDKIKLIVEFTKNSLRLHPFADGNHTILVGGLLNYLLLSQGIGICPMEQRRQFILNGVDESIEAVKKNLIPMEKLTHHITVEPVSPRAMRA